MRVSVLQTDIRWRDVDSNIAAAEQLIEHNHDADLYVLPEMWATGFAVRKQDLSAEDPAEKALTWMKHAAKKYDAAICGSLSVMLNDLSAGDDRSEYDRKKFANRHFFVMPNGETHYYDKHHLFTIGGEGNAFKAGNSRCVVGYHNVRFLLMTCYDLRFPVWMRYKGDYDAIILVANWPESRIDAWNVLLKARAIENRCYVIACNRIGDDKYYHYNGHSMIVNPDGNIIAEAKTETEQCITADLSVEDLIKSREAFPVLDDRDI